MKSRAPECMLPGRERKTGRTTRRRQPAGTAAAAIERAGRNVVPTPAGREYLEQVSVALGLLSRSSCHRSASVTQRRLRVTLPPTFARQLFIAHLAEFTAAHADIELELLLSIPYLDISAPGCDLEVRFGDGSYEGYESELLVDEPVFPVCTPRYLSDVGGLSRPVENDVPSGGGAGVTTS